MPNSRSSGKRRYRARSFFALPLALSILLPFAAALAQDEAAEPGQAAATAPPAEEKKQYPPGFEPVAGKNTEQVDASKLVVAAYAAFFIGMFGFVVYVARRQAEMAKEFTELGQRIGGQKK